MRAKYQRGRQSVHQYLRMTSIVNPHASISLIVRDRDGSTIEEDLNGREPPIGFKGG